MRKHASQTPPAELSAEDLAAQEAAELPDREAMTLINPAVLGAESGALPATGPDATAFAGQSAHDASAMTSGAVADAAAQEPSQTYQPAVTNVARS
jgi:hypothetical protein